MATTVLAAERRGPHPAAGAALRAYFWFLSLLSRRCGPGRLARGCAQKTRGSRGRPGLRSCIWASHLPEGPRLRAQPYSTRPLVRAPTPLPLFTLPPLPHWSAEACFLRAAFLEGFLSAGSWGALPRLSPLFLSVGLLSVCGPQQTEPGHDRVLGTLHPWDVNKAEA